MKGGLTTEREFHSAYCPSQGYSHEKARGSGVRVCPRSGINLAAPRQIIPLQPISPAAPPAKPRAGIGSAAGSRPGRCASDTRHALNRIEAAAQPQEGRENRGGRPPAGPHAGSASGTRHAPADAPAPCPRQDRGHRPAPQEGRSPDAAQPRRRAPADAPAPRPRQDRGHRPPAGPRAGCASGTRHALDRIEAAAHAPAGSRPQAAREDRGGRPAPQPSTAGREDQGGRHRQATGWASRGMRQRHRHALDRIEAAAQPQEGREDRGGRHRQANGSRPNPTPQIAFLHQTRSGHATQHVVQTKDDLSRD